MLHAGRESVAKQLVEDIKRIEGESGAFGAYSEAAYKVLLANGGRQASAPSGLPTHRGGETPAFVVPPAVARSGSL